LAQAQALRDEASTLRTRLDQQAQQRRQDKIAKIDAWIDDLLVAQRLDPQTEVLRTVTQVSQLLQDKRMSEEHILQIFRRLSEASPQSRSRLSPLVELLVDACGVMDCLDAEEQSNKRWSGRVERKLRRRLFAADWGIDLDELEEEEKVTGRGPRC
jgi:ribosomal protein L16 Arg81 hydroxylase